MISSYPLYEAIELTTNSGAEVPKETMVNPIIKSDTLYFLASADAPSTNQLAPNINAVKPVIIKIDKTIIYLVCTFNFVKQLCKSTQ